MPKPTHHVFVCVNERPEGGRACCAGRGARDIVNALRAAVAKRPGLWGTVQVTPSHCLGPCFEGPNAVVYPDAVWYEGLTVADVEELVEEHLVAGRPLARRVRQDEP